MKNNTVYEGAEYPIFLIGSERSGSTLLRLMLSHHPQLAFHSESDYIIQPLINQKEEPKGRELREYYVFLRGNRAFRGSGFIIDGSLSYRELLRSFLRQKIMLTGKPIVGMTVHFGFEHLPKIWPEARYIHLVRDGRDVAHSAMKMGWYGNVWAATERWKNAIASYDKLNAQISSSNIIEVRFEQLVSNPETELARLSDFIRISYDKSFFDYSKTSSYSSPGQKKAANWRDHFTRETTRLVESEIGDLLKRFNYELSGLDPVTISDDLRCKLLNDNKRLVKKSKIQKYGFWLLAINKFAEKLRLAQLSSITKSEIEKITQHNIK
ncbi:sulfotransferase family protein [Desulfurivibrio sp. D14AmB]|uniref:sulfotransferase family protein n=1 Tax=Desulfurivibrio sp. D14AmB TaxID=3374370 RepID=UPI00376F197E